MLLVRPISPKVISESVVPSLAKRSVDWRPIETTKMNRRHTFPAVLNRSAQITGHRFDVDDPVMNQSTEIVIEPREIADVVQ